MLIKPKLVKSKNIHRIEMFLFNKVSLKKFLSAAIGTDFSKKLKLKFINAS